MNPDKDIKNKINVLLLEDSPEDAEMIYEYLVDNYKTGIQMDIVMKQEEYISAISTKKYDYILADFALLDFDGFTALGHVQSICPSTPFICVSGYIGEETAVELLKRGATDYVSKDKLGRLPYAIERALKEAKEKEEKEKYAAELLIANKELTFQNEEKAKRATELAIANKKLVIQNKEILFLGHHDFLTNLYNRIHFEGEKKRLDTPRQLPLSIIMGDINGLRLINDGFGHAKGDEILIETAKILKSCCREEDIVSRIGGDEFAILLPQTDSKSAQSVCNRIADTCKVYALDKNLISPSISVGHATKTLKTETMDCIVMAAEESMSRQKLLESKSAHSAIIASIKVIMFEKSNETEEHAERMVKLSKSIGVAMSLTEDQLNELELLSVLHDIGKMGMDVKIYQSPVNSVKRNGPKLENILKLVSG